jgi:AraC-like DNA-binding protein
VKDKPAQQQFASFYSPSVRRLSMLSAGENQLRGRSMDTAMHSGGSSEFEFSATIARLLDAAVASVDKNREAAKDCITRAAALIQAERRGKNPEDSPASMPTKLFRGGLAPWQAKRVAAHIESQLASKITAKDFVELTGLSTSYFFRAFRISFGVSPFSYIAERRVARAQEMMLTTDEPLSQLAIACGLCDQSHLCRTFRRIVGVTPNAWRREHGSRTNFAALQ